MERHEMKMNLLHVPDQEFQRAREEHFWKALFPYGIVHATCIWIECTLDALIDLRKSNILNSNTRWKKRNLNEKTFSSLTSWWRMTYPIQ